MEEKDNKIKTVHRKTEKTNEHLKLTIIVIINMEKTCNKIKQNPYL
jgi:hypothetical protein